MGGFFGAIGGPGDGRRAGTNMVMRGAGAGKIGGVAIAGCLPPSACSTVRSSASARD